jgi:hypothetical protein
MSFWGRHLSPFQDAVIEHRPRQPGTGPQQDEAQQGVHDKPLPAKVRVQCQGQYQSVVGKELHPVEAVRPEHQEGARKREPLLPDQHDIGSLGVGRVPFPLVLPAYLRIPEKLILPVRENTPVKVELHLPHASVAGKGGYY